MTRETQPAESATPVGAILSMLGACFLFALLDTSAKVLVLAGMPAPYVVWWRFAVHTVLSFFLLGGWQRPSAVLRASSLPRQFLRAVFLVGSTLFNFLALRTLQLAETMAFYFFAPMVITALAGPLLGEWAGWRRWAAVAAGFLGVLVITRPGFGGLGPGHLYAALSTLSYCLYVIMTRALSTSESAQSLLFYSALVPAVAMLPMLPWTASLPAEPWHWGLLVLVGFFGGAGHFLLVRAYKAASTTALAPYPYSQMAWMILFGFLVFEQLPDLWTVAGSAIIVASGLYIVRREHKLRLAQRSVPHAEQGELAKKH